MTIEQQIHQICEKRRLRIPSIETFQDNWKKARRLFDHVGGVISNIPNDSHELAPLRAILDEGRIAEVRRLFDEAQRKIEVVNDRCRRNTIRIGVTGKARQGKSTLLQSISGLEDDALPTHDGGPVTAVRSRIFHDPSRKVARITFYTFKEFLSEVVDEYHRALGLPTAAGMTEEQFLTYDYPERFELIDHDRNNDFRDLTEMRRRLLEIRESFPSYRIFLVDTERECDITDFTKLRQFVSYPSIDDERTLGKECPRLYLAVKSIIIYCAFPHANVQNLALVDLPGLGENAANAEEHYREAVREGVDFVLFVRRPSTGGDLWGKNESECLRLLNEIQENVFQENDFVHVVFNTGGISSDQAESAKALQNLIHDMERQRLDKPLVYYEVDVKNEDNVSTALLEPVLQHLVESIPRMDEQVWTANLDAQKSVLEKLESLRGNLLAELNALSKKIESPLEEQVKFASKLKTDIARSLHDVIRNYEDQFAANRYSNEIMDKIEQQNAIIEAWVDDGFGVSDEMWHRKCDDAQIEKFGRRGFLEDQCNVIRVEISKKYKELDIVFDNLFSQLFDQVADALRNNLGSELVEQSFGRESLYRLKEKILSDLKPAQDFAESLEELLQYKLSYQHYVYPEVRPKLKELRPDGELTRTLINPDPAKPANEVLDDLRVEVHSFLYEVRQEVEKTAVLPGKTILAALEHFDDRIIRADGADSQIRYLVEAHGKEICPEKFGRPNIPSQMSYELRSRLRELEDLLKTLHHAMPNHN